jgi:tRNA dimethylallyltransferase
MSGPKRAVLIAGPTASGKSALAMRLAERLNGVVINADSMQVYRDLRIITARPSKQEEARVPHRLYGHVDASVNYSVGAWCYDVRQVLDQADEYGRVPILVGGTGLYFTVVTKGLAAVPPIPSEIRERVRGKLAKEGVGPLYQELLERDPAAAHRLMPNDRSRISRALEVVLATGRSLAEWHREGMPPLIDAARAAKVFITCEREQLKRRIEARFAEMLAVGAHEEVRALAARNLDPSLPAMKAHGVPWLIHHLRREITLDEAAGGSVMDTRRYAKRQVTWFKNQLRGWPWAPAEEAEAEIIRQTEALQA